MPLTKRRGAREGKRPPASKNVAATSAPASHDAANDTASVASSSSGIAKSKRRHANGRKAQSRRALPVLGDFVSNAVAKADASARGAREPSAHSVTGARAVPDWGAALARGGPRTRVRQSAGVISSPIHEVSVTRMSDVAQLRAACNAHQRSSWRPSSRCLGRLRREAPAASRQRRARVPSASAFSAASASAAATRRLLRLSFAHLLRQLCAARVVAAVLGGGSILVLAETVLALQTRLRPRAVLAGSCEAAQKTGTLVPVSL